MRVFASTWGFTDKCQLWLADSRCILLGGLDESRKEEGQTGGFVFGGTGKAAHGGFNVS